MALIYLHVYTFPLRVCMVNLTTRTLWLSGNNFAWRRRCLFVSTLERRCRCVFFNRELWHAFLHGLCWKPQTGVTLMWNAVNFSNVELWIHFSPDSVQRCWNFNMGSVLARLFRPDPQDFWIRLQLSYEELTHQAALVNCHFGEGPTCPPESHLDFVSTFVNKSEACWHCGGELWEAWRKKGSVELLQSHVWDFLVRPEPLPHSGLWEQWIEWTFESGNRSADAATLPSRIKRTTCRPCDLGLHWVKILHGTFSAKPCRFYAVYFAGTEDLEWNGVHFYVAQPSCNHFIHQTFHWGSPTDLSTKDWSCTLSTKEGGFLPFHALGDFA